MSRNFDLLQKIRNERDVTKNELGLRTILQAAAVAPQVQVRLGEIDLSLADSPTPGGNVLTQTGQRNQAPIQSIPQAAETGDRVPTREFCQECGMLVPKNCLFCPECGAFQGSIAEEDSDGSMPTSSGRLTGWLQVLRRRTTPERILVGTALALLIALVYVVAK